MRRIILALIGAGAVLAAGAARADTLPRVRAAGLLRCGGAIRPGLAFPAVDHVWYGVEVDLCRAIAAAAIGPEARIAFTGYALGPDFDRIRTGADDVAFLTTTELFANTLIGAVLVGPTVYQQTTNVMVWDARPIRHVGELGATMVCAEPGTPAERNLRDYAERHNWHVTFSAWMELEEMMDAYTAGRCPAVVGEATALAALRLGPEQAGHASRILPEPLAVTPLGVATAIGDGPWASAVRWIVETVSWAADPHRMPDAQSLPINGAALGLDGDWQARAVGAAGSLLDMQARSLGGQSPLGLPAGLNASWREGGARVAPAVE